MTVFDLGRMRHIDLLAEWHRRHPDSHRYDALMIGRLSKDRLAAELAST